MYDSVRHSKTLYYMPKPFSIRMPDDLYDSVLQYAENECRTMTGAVERLLRLGLERRDDIPQTKGQSKTEGILTEISHPRRQRVKGADTASKSGRQLGAGETGIQVAEGTPEGSARRATSSEPDGLDDGSHPVLIEGEVCENPKCGFPVHEYRPGMAAMKWICTNPERRHPQEPRSRVVIGGRLPDDFDFPEDEDGSR